MYTDGFQRFADAYHAEIWVQIHASKEGCVDSLNAWDGYAFQAAAA